MSQAHDVTPSSRKQHDPATDPQAAAATPPGAPAARSGERLRLKDVRAIFRLINEVRDLGGDPQKWRRHMIQRLGKLLRAGIVVSSEIHFRRNTETGTMKVIDIGWVCDTDGQTTQVHTEREDESPEAFWLTAGGNHDAGGGSEDRLHRTEGVIAEGQSAGGRGDEGELVPVRPSPKVYGGTSFILSQVALPHAGTVDQLGLHREWGDEPFTRAEHKLVRLFHVELGRLWRLDAMRQAEDPAADLPPRLAQTLKELDKGNSEKQIALKLELSRHTIHNYVKALHQRFGASSRTELLNKARETFTRSAPTFMDPDPHAPPTPATRAGRKGGRKSKSPENSAGGAGV